MARRHFPVLVGREDKIDELSRLRQELAKVKEERDILKKAAAYFAKELG